MFGYIGFHLILYFRRIFVFICIYCCSSIAYAEALYVVVSDNLRGVAFSQSQLKRIFLGEITSLQGRRVRLIYPSYSSKSIITLSKFVGKGGNVRDLKSYWSKMIFTGRGNPPETAENDNELKKYLQQENAIGVATSPNGMNVVYVING